MQVSVLSSVNNEHPLPLLHKTAIVIDVLRATSNIITAFMHGCHSIIPVETIEQALNLQKSGDLLGGERGCLRISGFDLGNSCLEYSLPQIQARRIILTTTNGTRVIQQSSQAGHVLVGAFLNAQACAAVAFQLNLDICILCAGTHGLFSLEDGLCAGIIVDELIHSSPSKLEIDDLGLCLHASYLQLKDALQKALIGCTNGQKLGKLGFSEDVAYCAQIGITDLVPSLANGVLLPYVLKTPVLHTLSRE